MKRLIKVLKIVLLIVFFAIIVFLINLIWFKPFTIDLFFKRVMISDLFNDPQLITSLKVPVLYNWKKDDLNDISIDQQLKLNSKIEKDLSTLRKYKPDNLSKSNHLSKKIIEWYMLDKFEGIPYCFHNYPVNQFNGIQNSLPSYLDTYHQVQSESDAGSGGVMTSS